jgi:dimethylamine/trimethylamine dehydrogenase
VLVLGGGPAGMECARVLGERGMRRVHLVEADAELGGCMRWIPRLPGLGEWARVVNWRAIQLKKLRNVELITGVRLSAQDALEYGAELVVVATGSHWAADGLNPLTHEAIPGAEGPDVLTPEAIMVEGAEVGDRVLIYDCDGYFVAASLAERLAAAGKHVTVVSPAAEIGGFLHATGEAAALYRCLYELGADLVPNHKLTQIGPGLAHGGHHYCLEPVSWSADTVVLVTQRVSYDEVYRTLEPDPEALAAEGVMGVFRAGDCVQPRLIADAIFDGHRLAREIDSDDPAAALPFNRERLVALPTAREVTR